MIILEPNHLQIVKAILKQQIPRRKIVVFGSRANGTPKKYSDLDLCVMGKKPLSLKQQADLREAFSESDLPIRVDIVDWATTTPEFQAIIQANSVDI